MKHLKTFNEQLYYVNGSDLSMYINGTYTSDSNGYIDVDGDVELYGCYKRPPKFKFGKVTGDFNIGGNELTSLVGICPVEVGGNFLCKENNLTSLEGCPLIGNDLSCFDNNLTSLEGTPKIINGSIYAHTNNLNTLNGCPSIVNGGLYISVNDKLFDFYGCGEINYKMGGYISCHSTPVDEIFRLCPTYEFVAYLNEFRPIRGNTILGKRLQECLYMCDKDIDVTKLKFKKYILLE